MTEIFYHEYTIIGHSYLLGATTKGLAFVGSADQTVAELKQFYPKAQLTAVKALQGDHATQIQEYLTGQRQKFTLPLDITGTSFQESVWQALLQIPYGQTTDYTQIAQTIKHEKASRAVGTAVGKNPVLMVIPCHRVITKSGQLGGYRGGLPMKQVLLALERQ